MISLSDGRFIVQLARQTVKDYLDSGNFEIKKTKFTKKQGTFVTIHTYPEHNLRGCIGYAYPVIPLGEAVQRAALSSAFEDPRFQPLVKEEFNKVIFEVSILTEPKLIAVTKPKNCLKKIEIGKDGLIVEYGSRRGLLLPQVPLEFTPPWDADTFLQHACMKAMLSPDMWLDDRTKIYKFQAEIFTEKTPSGKIIRT